MSKKLICLFIIALNFSACAQELSKDALLDFVNTRYHAYFHYNMCTFKNLNSEMRHGRSNGKEPVSMWNPTGLDCQQWAQVCKNSKMAGGWLTTKHHGGFCLWDSQYTDYDVASSPVKTDVVKVFTDAFRKAGLKIGLYYSILDYHHGMENGSVAGQSRLDLHVERRAVVHVSALVPGQEVVPRFLDAARTGSGAVYGGRIG